jgi:hypothetical protein
MFAGVPEMAWNVALAFPEGTTSVDSMVRAGSLLLRTIDVAELVDSLRVSVQVVADWA